MRYSTWLSPVLPALALLASPLLADSVTGTLRINDKSYSLQHAVGVRVPSSFLGGAIITRVAFSDAPILAEALRSSNGLVARQQEGPIHGVSMEFSDDQSYFSLSTISSEPGFSASISGTMENFQFTKHTPAQVGGRYQLPERALGQHRLAVDVQFDVTLLPPPPVAKTAVKTGAAAQSLPSVQAYLALRKAVQALDLAAIRQLARYPQDFQGPDGLKFAKMMKEEEPTGIAVVEASENGDTATLTVTGQKAGKPIRKTFEMQRKDGRWTTNNDNWEAN